MQIYTGLCGHTDTVTIPGVFLKQPAIMVSPYTLEIVPDVPGSQFIECAATNIQELPPGSGKWTFTAICSSSSPTHVEEIDIYNGTAPNTWSTPEYTSPPSFEEPPLAPPPSVRSFTVSGKVRTYRGSGASGYFILRQVKITLQIREEFESEFTDVSEIVVVINSIGERTPFYIDYTFPAHQANFTWKLKFEATDVLDEADEPILVGVPEYTYIDETLTTTYPLPSPNIALLPTTGADLPARAALPLAFTPTQSGEIYKIEYAINTLKLQNTLTVAGIYNGGIEIHHAYTQRNIFTKVSTNTYGGSDLISIPSNFWEATVDGLNLPGESNNELTLNLIILVFSSSSIGATLKLDLTKPITAKVYRRIPDPVSETPTNEYGVEICEYSPVNREVYGWGIAQWMAIGE